MAAPLIISLLGIGAMKLTSSYGNLFVDAFNSYNPPPALRDNDIVVFSHDDGDHFLPERLLPHLKDNIRIVGPPTIAYPLLSSGKVKAEQITILYPQNYNDPKTVELGPVKITAFNTEHFLDWHSVHTSFLFEIDGKRIYFGADSKIRKENESSLKNLDCLVYSLLQYEIVKKMEQSKYGKYYHLCELLDLKRTLEPKLIVGNHMIGCSWAADPRDVADLVAKERIEGVRVPASPEERIFIE